MKKIAVVGATGMLGAPVANAFAAKGYQVTIICRDEHKARRQFADENIDFAQADLFDSSALTNALRGIEAIHINLSGYSPASYRRHHVDGTASILAAVDPSSLQLISMISMASAYPQNAKLRVDTAAKLEAEALLKASGYNTLVYMPSWFFESLPLFEREGRVTQLGRAKQGIHWLSASDYAKAVVQSYETPSLYNTRLTLFGPEAMTMDTALKRFAHEKRFQYSYLPRPLAWLIGKMSQDERLQDAVDLLNYYEKVGENPEPDTLKHSLAIATTFEEWLAKMA